MRAYEVKNQNAVQLTAGATQDKLGDLYSYPELRTAPPLDQKAKRTQSYRSPK